MRWRSPCEPKYPTMTPVSPNSRSTLAFHDCIRDGRKFGSVNVGASAAAPACVTAVSILMLLAAVPAAWPDSGFTTGGLPVSPVKYPVLLWLTITAYAPRTTVLLSPLGFQMTPTRGWKSLPFLVTWL